MKRKLRIIVLLLVICAGVQTVKGLSLALDSIAAWGKFPHFCIDVYRWGDKFFNSYDTAYVKGTGYKFNVKFKADSWTDVYNFDLPDDIEMTMLSDQSITMGAYLTYLAVSAGYDINVSKLINGNDRVRRRINLGFNCSLIAAEWHYVSNDVGTTIKRIGYHPSGYNMNIPFDGINTSEWALDTYYFFNHKKYSQAAAFTFGRVQTKSQGSFFAGLSFSTQKYDFNFKMLPEEYQHQIPQNWLENGYNVATHNYAFRLGYGYNWVFARHWLLGVSESPIVGLRRGTVNSTMEKTSFALLNRLAMSVVWNNGRWFGGFLGNFDANLIYDHDHTLITGLLSAQLAVGYRFNIW